MTKPMSLQGKKIAVIIPCFNEAISLPFVIEELQGLALEFKIYIGNNASTDDTKQVAESYGTLVINEFRPGKGAMVRRLLREVDADVYVLIDGDFTYDLQDLHSHLQEFVTGRYDFAIGTRVKGEKGLVGQEVQGKEYRIGHELGNRFFAWFFRSLFNLDIKDPLSGYRIFSRSYVESLPLMADGFELEAELNMHAAALKIGVLEVNVLYRPRPHGSNSKLNTIGDGLRIARFTLETFRSRFPFRSFVILSIPWFVAAISLVGAALSDYLSTGLVARFPSLIAGVGAFAIGTNLISSGIALQRINDLKTTFIQIEFARSRRKHD